MGQLPKTNKEIENLDGRKNGDEILLRQFTHFKWVCHWVFWDRYEIISHTQPHCPGILQGYENA